MEGASPPDTPTSSVPGLWAGALAAGASLMVHTQYVKRIRGSNEGTFGTRRIRNSVTRGARCAGTSRAASLLPRVPGPKQPPSPRVGFGLTPSLSHHPVPSANDPWQGSMVQKT